MLKKMEAEDIGCSEIDMNTEEIVTTTDTIDKALNTTISEEDYRFERIKFSTLLNLKNKGQKEIVKWCMEIGLIASSYICPQCGEFMKFKTSKCGDGYIWSCRNKTTKYLRSIRNGSIFSRSKMNIMDILILIHCWIYKIPHEWILLELEFSNKVLTEWDNYCREICLKLCAKDYRKIGGDNKVVEIIGGKFYSKKSREDEIEDLFVFAGVEDMYADKTFIKLVEKCDKKTFLDVVENSVLPGTTVLSEFYVYFNCLEDEDCDNLAAKYSYKFEDPEIFAEQQISKQRKSFWSTIKNRLRRHNTKEGFFDNFIAEYIWRKKHSSAYDKMRKFILAIKTVFPLVSTDSRPEWFENSQ